jgi:hypothetical protein
LRSLAEWHYGEGPDYCRGCGPGGCGACPYEEHAPRSEAGMAAWQASGATVEATQAGADLGQGFLAAVTAQGVPMWVAVEWLAALRGGIHAAAAKRREQRDKEGTA